MAELQMMVVLGNRMRWAPSVVDRPFGASRDERNVKDGQLFHPCFHRTPANLIGPHACPDCRRRTEDGCTDPSRSHPGGHGGRRRRHRRRRRAERPGHWLVAGGGAIALGTGEDDSAEQVSGVGAKAAALEITGGGDANSVELNAEGGATWEIEVTTTDGSTVDVLLDSDFDEVAVEDDSEDE